MQSAVPVGQGAMVAVMGVTPDQAKELCLWVQSKCDSKNLDPANFNCPGQVVISGSKSLIDWLIANYSDEAFAESKPKRIKFIPLNVSAPFHSSLMKPAEAQMRDVLEGITFSDSDYPIVQNFSAEATQNGQVLRENLIRQISAPVRWVECVEKLVQLGGRRMIEMGCGKVLTGLVKKIDGNNIESFNINSMIELNALEKALQS
jgi:[acyl-carrier-protein] S-malonyltransferase